LVDRRLVVSGWLQRLKREGVEIHVRSAFLQGLLLMSREMIPLKFELWAEQWDHWHSWLLHNPATAVQACLNYPLSFPEVDRVIIGADSSAQLLEIIEASKIDPIIDFPDLYCADEKLINPSNWTKL
jgi:aryl-alcohol dehydrogenase-like predicted oxidoreductase